jgi:hypothetical protein
MSRILVVTNPSDDRVTEYLDSWSAKAIDLAKAQPDTFVFELRKEQANKAELVKLIEDKKPHLILFNGHGDHDFITGFDQEVLIKSGENEELLKNIIVHAMSCNAGKTLGPEAIKIGSVAYIGYKEEFKLTHLNKTTKAEQLADDVAKFFLEPAYEVIIALIEGNTVEQAYQRSRGIYADNLTSLMTSTHPDINPTIVSRLYHNYLHQVCLGNTASTF